MSHAPVLPASTTLPAASNTMSSTGTPRRRPSSCARSTEMPVGPVCGPVGLAASTALPTLIAARSLPLGARSDTAAAGGFCGVDAQAAATRVATASKAIFMRADPVVKGNAAVHQNLGAGDVG